MFDEDDVAALVDPDDFGTAATVNGEAVNGVFSRRYEELLGGDVEGQSLEFTCSAALAAGAAQGTPVVIDGKTYTVVKVRPLRGGLVALKLND